MNSIWVSLLLTIVQRLVGGDFFNIVKELVLAAASTNYTDTPEMSANQQRKLAVTKQLKALQDDFGNKAKSMGGWLLSIAIDAAVGYLRGKGLIR